VITRQIVPALEGLAQRLSTPGAKHLDVGVGVAGTAIALAQQWPALSVVGIDVWQPSLALARQNISSAGLGDRIELREQAVENLEDNAAFDLAWLPVPFIPERVVPDAVTRIKRSLRPGGWFVFTYIDVEGLDPVPTPLWRLRVSMFGGPLWSTREIEKLMKEKGFADVRPLPRHPGVPAGFVVGRLSE
jgi:ubiquinone/menaquinone biosynthesis C-methylase UbiE